MAFDPTFLLEAETLLREFMKSSLPLIVSDAGKPKPVHHGFAVFVPSLGGNLSFTFSTVTDGVQASLYLATPEDVITVADGIFPVDENLGAAFRKHLNEYAKGIRLLVKGAKLSTTQMREIAKAPLEAAVAATLMQLRMKAGFVVQVSSALVDGPDMKFTANVILHGWSKAVYGADAVKVKEHAWRMQESKDPRSPYNVFVDQVFAKLTRNIDVQLDAIAPDGAADTKVKQKITAFQPSSAVKKPDTVTMYLNIVAKL